jgi:hypothetical protein
MTEGATEGATEMGMGVAVFGAIGADVFTAVGAGALCDTTPGREARYAASSSVVG